MDICSENLDLRIGKAISKIRPYIVDLIAYDIILSKSWLASVNPIINWKANRMRIEQGHQVISMDVEAPKHGVSRLTFMFTSKKFERLAKKKRSPLYHVLLKPKNDTA